MSAQIRLRRLSSLSAGAAAQVHPRQPKLSKKVSDYHHQLHSTEAYLNFFRSNNGDFYQLQYFDLDEIVIKFGPWIQKLNELSYGRYVNVPIFFALTLLDSDIEDEYKTNRKSGHMFGTTMYQDYYPSGEIVMECLRYRLRGYRAVRVEFLFTFPYILADSIENFFVGNLDLDKVDSLNYNTSPTAFDFKRVFKIKNEDFDSFSKVLKLFITDSSVKKKRGKIGLIINYLPSTLQASTTNLLEYYQDEFTRESMEYSYSTLKSYSYSSLQSFESTSSTKFSIVKSVEATDFEDSTVKSYLFKGDSMNIKSGSEVPATLLEKLTVHPYYISNGSVYSFSEEIIHELIILDQKNIDSFDVKIQRLFQLFGNEE